MVINVNQITEGEGNASTCKQCDLMIVSLSHHMLLNFIKQSCELAQTKGDTVQIIGL